MTLTDDLFHDTGDQQAVPATTKELAEKANAPASEAYVDGELVIHKHTCWARRRLRRYALAFAFLAGVMVTGQALAVWLVKASLTAARLELRETVRETVDQVLREKKILGLAPPAVGGAVALTEKQGGLR